MSCGLGEACVVRSSEEEGDMACVARARRRTSRWVAPHAHATWQGELRRRDHRRAHRIGAWAAYAGVGGGKKHEECALRAPCLGNEAKLGGLPHMRHIMEVG